MLWTADACIFVNFTSNLKKLMHHNINALALSHSHNSHKYTFSIFDVESLRVIFFCVANFMDLCVCVCVAILWSYVFVTLLPFAKWLWSTFCCACINSFERRRPGVHMLPPQAPPNLNYIFFALRLSAEEVVAESGKHEHGEHRKNKNK